MVVFASGYADEARGCRTGYCLLSRWRGGKVIEKGVTYYPLRFPKHSWKEKAQAFICSANTLIVNERKRIPLYEEIIRKPLEDFKPDVIMVFGSEMPFGLVAGITDIPVILHIQGILNPCLNAYLPPFVSWKEYKSIGNGWKTGSIRGLNAKCGWFLALVKLRYVSG